MVHYFEPMVSNATGSSSHLLNSKQQMMMLDQSKTVTECALQLIYAAKEAGGNPKVSYNLFFVYLLSTWIIYLIIRFLHL